MEDRRERNNAVVKELKARLGLNGFKTLQGLSIAFQHGKMAIDAYYNQAMETLQGDAALLLELASLLPDKAKSQAIKQHHLTQSDPTPAPVSEPLDRRPRDKLSRHKQPLSQHTKSSKGGFAFSGPRAKAKQGERLVLQDGLVLLKKVLSPETQQWLIDRTFELGNGIDGAGGGFYKMEGDLYKLNRGTKGRVIAPIEDFPQEYKDECQEALANAMSVDPTLPAMDANVVLVNFYSDKGNLNWHRDNDEGKANTALNLGRPVVSFSIGDAADFGYKWKMEDQEKVVRLESGDVLIFGGPSRMILHSVIQVYPNTKPRTLKMNRGRLNITFRDHSELDDSEINLGYDGDNRLHK
ncbi:hypothetical protein CYMTET_54112 [Cymbomonas tetramitiformis]|uniref:Fe2OG dioxygenase domain-containing protein n=1 Tax=Cymbomonas tetramitiformis TaxID=36881 RepID=A0AAE0EP27_9CHLO|nr:hypothetical protein CYMTET_54112 [Cymbomonas tetramitiformis]